MTWDNLSTTVQTILLILGSLSVLIAGGSNIIKLFNPFKRMGERLDNHDKMFEDNNRRFDAIEKETYKQHKMQREMCKSLIAMMNHEITGNGTDRLKQCQSDLQQFLIDN